MTSAGHSPSDPPTSAGSKPSLVDGPADVPAALPSALLRVRDYGTDEVRHVLALARRHREGRILPSRRHEGRVLSTVFLQPSTRTSLSFRAAAYALGADVLDMSAGPPTRMDDFYAEPLHDVLLHLQEYSDAMVVRHHQVAPPELVDRLEVPFINAGDGFGGHPTQALGDLLTLTDVFGGDLQSRCWGSHSPEPEGGTPYWSEAAASLVQPWRGGTSRARRSGGWVSGTS